MQTFLIDFLSNYTSESITLENTIMVLGIACILACYIFVVYRLVTKKIFYSKSFNIALAVIAVVTAAIILAVQSSIVISLGMVVRCLLYDFEQPLRSQWIFVSYSGR